MRLIAFNVALLAVCVGTSDVNAQSPETAALSARLDSVMKEAVARYRVAGISAAVVRGRDTLLNRGYGLADIGLNVPATSETRYRVVGPHLATAVMQQVEAGRVRLNDDVAPLLPDFPWQGKRVTLRQLMDATSGLPDFHYLGDTEFKYVAMPKPPTQVTALVAGLPFTHEPGASWQWTITGLHLAGDLVERLSGMTYENYLQQRIIQPAKLQHTQYCGDRDVVPGLPRTYTIAFDGARYSPPESATSYPYIGTVCATALDAVRILRAMRNGTLLKQESWRAITTAEGAARNAGSGARGVGLRMGQEEGHAWVGESGSLLGFGSAVMDFEADSLTIAVMTNTTTQVPATVARNLARTVLGLSPVPGPTIATPPPLRELQPLSAAEHAKYVGTYRTTRVNAPPQYRVYVRTYSVFTHNGRLMLYAIGEEATPLLHQEGDVFVTRGATVKFAMDGGKAKGIELTFGNVILRGDATSPAELKP